MHSDLAFSVLTASASGTFSWSVSARKGLMSWGSTAANKSVARSTCTWNLLLISLRVKCEYAMVRTPKHAENERGKNQHPLLTGTALGTSYHLRQCGFRLGQPEGHVHGPVQRDGGGQGGTGQPPLAGRGIQCAEAPVAMGLERTHPQFLGQGEG